MAGNRRSGRPFGFLPESLLNYVRNNRYTRDVENLVESASAGPRAQAELQSDEQLANHLHNNNFADTGRLVYGHVVHALPYANFYRVQLDDFNADLACTKLMSTSANLGSVRESAVIAPNTRVLVWCPHAMTEGVILGAVPPRMQDGSRVFPDMIAQGLCTGFKREPYYSEVLDLLEDEGGIADFSSHRPLDQLTADWAQMGDSGAGISVDQFMTYLRVDETCGLYLFYMDRLARLTGYNLDILSAVSEMMVRNDSGEGLIFSGYSPYSWEASGQFDPNQDPSRENDDKSIHYKSAESKFEPEDTLIKPFYRLEEHRGYLGQGFLRQVIVPPPSASGSNTYNEKSHPLGVFHEQVGLDGSWAIASAHSLSLQKRVILPVPLRKKVAEDPEGDNLNLAGDGDYKFASQFGSGPEHKIGSVKTAGDEQQMAEAAGVLDIQAHTYNWKGLHPFTFHTEDFSVPEQGDTSPFEKLHPPPMFDSLQSSQFTEVPTAVSAKVDHRYNEVNYYETTAGIEITPTGAVVIRGSAGEEIRLSGGSIQISAPGDVWLQPGRGMNIYAGDDIILRANKSVDITANEKDIRLKSEGNTQVLAGNGGRGGILLESRADAPYYEFDEPGEKTQSSGIMLRAPRSEIVSWSSGVYLRTGSEDGTVDPGDIVLDANQGDSGIHTVSRVFDRTLRDAAHDVFPVPDEGNPTTVNTYNSRVTQLQTQVQISGGLIIRERGIFMRGWLTVLDGHVLTELSEQYHGLISVFDADSLRDNEAIMTEFDEDFEARKEQAKTDYDNNYTNPWTETKRPGNESLIKDAEFSLRDETDMGTSGFKLVECYWQQLQGQGTGWTEKSVKFHNNEMYPHPGKSAWTESPTWYRMELKFHDAQMGTDKERSTDGGPYATPELNELQPEVPQGAYPIIPRS